jgi:hypothetical protein
MYVSTYVAYIFVCMHECTVFTRIIFAIAYFSQPNF